MKETMEWTAKKPRVDVSDLAIRGKIIPAGIIEILAHRGFDTPEKVERFFAPSLSDLHDPFLFRDMGKAVERIVRARQNKEKVMIHGDYDADGISATALMVIALRRIGVEVFSYIPNRFFDGYGLARNGIDQAWKKNCRLLITVDCGITAHEQIDYAESNKINIIVCDHHVPGQTMPRAYAILNPKIDGERYPFKELSGAGIAFKLVQAIGRHFGIADREIHDHLDLAALGTVVDLVPLIDENRVIAKFGIKKMAGSAKVGIRSIMENADLHKNLTAYHLNFMIGPRINACGRLRDARDALELLTISDPEKARILAGNLANDNQQRQKIEQDTFFEARSMVDQEPTGKQSVIVLGKREWHEGIIGIVASRLVDEFYRPAILLSIKDDLARGSARSIAGFNITEALGKCREILINFGGHSQAAGLSLPVSQIASLGERINALAAAADSSVFQRRAWYDLPVGFDDLSDDFLFFLKYFEPTGMGNPQPVFCGENLEIVGVPRVVGKGHLKFALRQNNRVFEAIAYQQAESILDLEAGKTSINCLFSIAEETFSTRHKIILKVKAIKKL